MVLRSAQITFKDELAGTLVETVTGGTRFCYIPGWGETIACGFPVTAREHEYQVGLHPFFQHLSAEGWLREQQARAATIADQDDLGLLLRYGADCIGAVSVRPAIGAGPAPPHDNLTDITASPGRTISGIQKKLIVVFDTATESFRPADAIGPAPFIAKFNSPFIDTLVRNEALSLRWVAAVLGEKEVNRFRLAHIPSLNELALVVTRFDRGSAGEKFRLEDFAQILGKPRGADYAGKYDGSYEEVAATISLHSSRPVIDLSRFFRRLIVYAIVGNCDAHLKNFSLLERPEGLRLSPAYDILNTALYPGHDQTLALTIGGNRTFLDAVDSNLLQRFGLSIGLPERAVTQTFTDLARHVRKATAAIQPPPAEGPDGFVTRFAEVVRDGCLRILGDRAL